MSTESVPQVAIAALSESLKKIPQTSDRTARDQIKENIVSMGGVALTSSDSAIKRLVLDHYQTFNSLRPDENTVHNAVELKTETDHLAAAIAITSSDETVHQAAIKTIGQTLEVRAPWPELHTDGVFWIAAIANSSTKKTKNEAIQLLKAYSQKKKEDYGYTGANQQPQAVETAIKLIGVLGAS